MKFKQLVSKVLVTGIFISNTGFNSLASTLSEDTRYETFEGDSIKIDGILEENKVDVEIEGNTLVNLAPQDWTVGNSVTGHGVFDKVNKIYTAICDGTYSHFAFTNSSLDIIKPNTNYTLIFKTIREGSTLNKSVKLFNAIDIENFSTERRISISEGVQYHKVLIDVNDRFVNSGATNSIQMRITLDNITDGSLKLSELILLEGDWTNKETPSYFEGLKSAGESDKNSDSIEIMSENKNLFYGEFEFGGYRGTTGEPYPASDRIRTKNTIRLKKGIYSASCVGGAEFIAMELFKNGAFVKEIGYHTNNMYPYVLDEDYDVHLTVGTTNLKAAVQIELGKKATEYIDHQSDNKKFFLKEPLRGIEGSVKDRVIKKSGQWVVERNYGQLIVDGSQPILKEYTYAPINTELTRFNVKISEILEGEGNKLLSDKFPYIYIHPGGSVNISQECISNHSNDRGFLNVVVKKSRLKSDDINGFKDWISNNPIIIIYRLENPIYEPINVDLAVQLFEDTTYISSNSSIPANMKVTVDRVANRAKEFSDAAKLNPTSENISLARMWINLMDESTLKDQFQENISNIANIDDLQLERKSASSNLDVYVKSQNMLSISLNTNSVTFDGYSGTEDMEKLGAVNISINSSLPYSLNAYMSSEIANSDKSETMPIDILNIRDSSEGIYKTFDNTADKVILKDNCSNGNGLIHGIDLKLASNLAHKADVYKTVIKFEAEQK